MVNPIDECFVVFFAANLALRILLVCDFRETAILTVHYDKTQPVTYKLDHTSYMVILCSCFCAERSDVMSRYFFFQIANDVVQWYFCGVLSYMRGTVRQCNFQDSWGEYNFVHPQFSLIHLRCLIVGFPLIP